ncbi:MAG: winged helix-turn-helix domain-containing protein, partial [Candidatus Bathyarchaeota archaeon]|nr:winged helix-turn-helix domain-containing protein [Candidatus Bathyarchaeota archaeon]
ELRLEINKFRAEIRQRLEVIENEVNKQVALNYNRTIIEYVKKTSIDLVENLNCNRPDEEAFCKSQMSQMQTPYLQHLEAGNFPQAYAALEKAQQQLSEIGNQFQKEERLRCVGCIESQTQLLESNKRLISQLRLIESPAVALGSNNQTIDQLNPAITNDSIVNPISNKTRIQILQSIYRGENRFTDLSTNTGLEGGQLLYHIKKLTEADYVYQAENKDYVLTTKGLRVLVMLAQLSQELS